MVPKELMPKFYMFSTWMKYLILKEDYCAKVIALN